MLSQIYSGRTAKLRIQGVTMNAPLLKALTLVGASQVAFILFGLTYSATVEEGVLRATSVGLLAGLLGFAMSVFAVWLFLDLGK